MLAVGLVVENTQLVCYTRDLGLTRRPVCAGSVFICRSSSMKRESGREFAVLVRNRATHLCNIQ